MTRRMVDSFRRTGRPPWVIRWKLREILPQVLNAGEEAGTPDRRGREAAGPHRRSWKPGVPLCPPEGDAGTGMAATNSVAVRTGNVSAGTSVFAMIVLEKPLSKVYPEIDMVTTPSGKPGGHGSLQQLHQRHQRLGRYALSALRSAAGLEINKGDVYTTLFERCHERRSGLRRGADPLQLSFRRAYHRHGGRPAP